MWHRFLTAVILTPVAIFSVYYGKYWIWLFSFTLSLLMTREMLAMRYSKHLKVLTASGFLLILVWYIFAYVGQSQIFINFPFLLLPIIGVLLLFVLEVFLGKLFLSESGLLFYFRVIFLGGVCSSFSVWLRYLPENGLKYLFFCCLIAWVGDSCAYFGGRLFGRHKLASQISPNKTIEGALISALSSIIIGTGFALIFELNLLYFVLISIILSISSQMGDLHESLTKRFFNVKDSSAILPGHGGVYDRVDGVLFMLPVAYLIFIL